MRDQALNLSRRVIAALPIAALFGPAAAQVAPCPVGNDAALLELGRRWQVACAALHANDPDTAEATEVDGDRLYEDEQKLFDPLMAMQPRTLEGLAVKARALARAFDVLSPDGGALEAAVDRAWDIEQHSALTLALDILRLTGGES